MELLVKPSMAGAPGVSGAVRARRVTVRSQEFVPYGVVADGSAERNAYTKNLQGYLAANLLPIFDAWQGDMPAHLQKARALAPPTVPHVHCVAALSLGSRGCQARGLPGKLLLA